MRKLLGLLLLALLTTAANAQTMSVKSFQQLQNDLDAMNPETQRIASNDGKPAALIKIRTTEKDFNFDGGTYSIVDNVYKPGEIWVYVPSRAQKISISHAKYGMLRDYYYDEPIESARVYELVLDLGVGRFTNIQTSIPRSIIYLDGDSLGMSPLANKYIMFGKHKLTAINDKMEGELEIEIDRNKEDASVDFNIPMRDQSFHYGQVIINTDIDAEIYIDDVMKGVGTFATEMREGNYVVETRKANCDPVKTSFTVEARKENSISATPPIPHKGYLKLFTRPSEVAVQLNGKPKTFEEVMALPVGRQELVFSRKGYLDRTCEYNITNNETIADSIYLDPIVYMKKTGYFFGASFVAGSNTGIALHAGATFNNIDLELSYRIGLKTSDAAYWYSSEQDNNVLANQVEYKQHAMSAKLGYQFTVFPRLTLVPQVGASIHKLSAKALSTGEAYGNGTTCACATVGVKMLYSPMRKLALFLSPEYDIAVNNTDTYKRITEATNLTLGGFYCHAGLMLHF